MNKLSMNIKKGGNLGTVPGTKMAVSRHSSRFDLPKGRCVIGGVPKLPCNL